MNIVILAGGLGTRLAEETIVKPKPMVEIGGKPILWHLMKIYAHAGHKDFYVALGYKGEAIKRYFADFHLYDSDMTVALQDRRIEFHQSSRLDWRVHLVDTGANTQTGGRIQRLQPHIGGETFMATYGDGLANVNLAELLDFHRSHGKIATLTAVRPPSRFGEIVFAGDRVVKFAEKPQTTEGWINGGFFVFEPEIFNFLRGDSVPLEMEPLESLVAEGQLMAYRHEGFWQPMDTLREKNILESLWNAGDAPWKVWK